MSCCCCCWVASVVSDSVRPQETAAHQAPPSLGFSRQEYWSGLPFPSPMHESEKWKGSSSVVSDSSRPHGLQPARLLRSWDFPGKSTGVGCHCLLRGQGNTKLQSAVAFYLRGCSVAHSCPTLCDPVDYRQPDSSIHGIFQAGILERVAMPHSGFESVSPESPALAGRFFTTEPPGKP